MNEVRIWRGGVRAEGGFGKGVETGGLRHLGVNIHLRGAEKADERLTGGLGKADGEG